MTSSLSKLAQEKLAQTRQSKIVKNIESKLPFEVNEETLKEIVNNILERAKEIRQALKKDPVATVKNYKALLDFNSLTVVKKKKTAKKKKTGTSAKKALRKTKPSAKKAVH